MVNFEVRLKFSTFSHNPFLPHAGSVGGKLFALTFLVSINFPFHFLCFS